MKKRILVWLMVLSMLLPTVCVNAAEPLNTGGSLQQEDRDSTQGESKTLDTEEKTLPEGDETPSPEPEEKTTPTPGQTEEPRETIEPTSVPTGTPEGEEPVSTETPEATSTPTETPEPEEVTPTPAKTPVAEATSTPTLTPAKTPAATALPTATATPTPTATPTSTASPTTEVKTRTYKLSHAGIIQEDKYPDDDFVRADELEEQVDLEGVKSFIVESLSEGKGEIDISEYQVPVFYIDQVISEVLNENPRFFYVSFDDCEVDGTTVRSLIPIYEGSRDEIVQASNEYEQAVARALSSIDNSMNAMEKACVLHDYLVTHCEYDQSYQRYYAYDALVTGSAVCNGYTLAYLDLLQRAGVPCTTARSSAMNHIWNMVLIDGSWYHVDTTWDDPLDDAKSYCGHSHFLASDSQLGKNHYDWTSSYSATNTRFDNAEWKSSESMIYKYQGDWYYMGTMGGGHGFIRRTGGLENGTSSIVQRITRKWYVWEDKSYIWTRLYGYITVFNNAIYFNDSEGVYKYKNGQIRECYTYTDGQGYLYDIAVINGKLYCGVSIGPQNTISYIEVVDFPFTDVTIVPGNWKYDSVKYVYDNDIMNGINGTTRFDPDEPLTRAMFATVLYRMAGEPATGFENRFSDVEDGRYYSRAIIWAYKSGIVTGYADGSYGVDDYITREQMAKMLRVYAQVRGHNTSERANIGSFPDAGDMSGWAVEHMSWAVGCGMINGKNIEGTYYLDAKGNATRVECAAMLMRFIRKYGK